MCAIVTSSFTEFSGHGFWAPDTHLELWASSLATAVMAAPAPPAWLVEASAAWSRIAPGSTVTFHLDEIVADDPERADAIVVICEHARGEILQQIRMLGAPAVATLYGVERMEPALEVAESFRALLLGRITWTRATAPEAGAGTTPGSTDTA